MAPALGGLMLPAPRKLAVWLFWSLLALLASLAAVAVLVPKRAYAATYWVSPTGNAGNSGADSTTNAKTLAWVNSNATSGDIIRFKSGTYSDPIAPTASGITTSRLRFYGFPQSPGAVKVASLTFGTRGTNRGDYCTARWITVSGTLTLQGSETAGGETTGDSLVSCRFTGDALGTLMVQGLLVDSCTFTRTYASPTDVRPLDFDGPGSYGVPNWWKTVAARDTVKHSTFNIAVLSTSGTTNVQLIHTAQCIGSYIADNTFNYSGGNASGIFMACEQYQTYNLVLLRNTFNCAFTVGPTGTRGVFCQRDSSRYAQYLGNTVILTGTGNMDGIISNSGQTGFAGTVGFNRFAHNVFATNMAWEHRFPGFMSWQNGCRSDTMEFNVFISTGDMPALGLGTNSSSDASSDNAISGLIFRHNTLYSGSKTVMDFGGLNPVGTASIFSSNAFYSTAANGTTPVVRVRSGLVMDSVGVIFARGGTASAGIGYAGVNGTPGSGGNYGTSGKTRWGSPQFMDTTAFASLNLAPHQFSYLLASLSPSLQDGFAGAFSDSTGGSAGTGATTYAITVTPGANGTITPGTTSVPSGNSQGFAIAANTGYSVSDVTVDGSSVGAVSSYTFTNVTATHTIASTNTINTYTITSSAGANGSISPSGATVKNYNTSQAYTITPSGGFHVANVLVDGVGVGSVTSYTFSGIAANHTISVTFVADATPPAIINVTISKLNSRWVGAQWDIVNDADTNSTVVVGVSDASVGSFDTTLTAVRLPGSSHYATSVFGFTPVQGKYLRIYVDDGANGKDSSKTSFVTAHEGDGSSWVRQPIKGPMVYVDPQGSDDSDGLYPYSPKRTIRAAYQKLLQQPSHGLGGAVVLAPGIYYQNNTLDDSDGWNASDQFARRDSMYHIVGTDPNATIISGADERLESGSLTLTWTSYGADSIWMAYYPADDSIGGVWFDGVLGANAIRCYKYTSITEIRNGTGTSGGGNWNWHSWGWYGRNDTLFVRTPDGSTPATHSIHTAYRPNLLYLRDPNIRVTGIGFQFAGDAGLPGNGIALRIGTGNGDSNRASNCEVDSCIFRNNTREAIYSIAAQSGLNDSVVVYDNQFYDDVYKFGYAAGKGRGEESVNVTNTDGAWWTIMNNVGTGFFNGITTTGDSTKLDREMEMTVTGNTIHHVADDAFEFDGGCAVNYRFFANRATRFNNGLSLAPVWRGPVWDIYNVFSYPSSGSGIWKLGNGGGSRLTGIGYHIHDTGYSPNGANVAGIYGVGQVKQQHWINCAFTGGATNWKPIRVSPTAGFDAADSTGNRSSDVNWCLMYNWAGANLPADWFATAYDTTTIKSSLSWQKNGLFSNPVMVDTSEAVAAYAIRGAGRDAGRRIAGVNDKNQFVTLQGSAPDMGAFEFVASSAPGRSWYSAGIRVRRRIRTR